MDSVQLSLIVIIICILLFKLVNHLTDNDGCPPVSVSVPPPKVADIQTSSIAPSVSPSISPSVAPMPVAPVVSSAPLFDEEEQHAMTVKIMEVFTNAFFDMLFVTHPTDPMTGKEIVQIIVYVLYNKYGSKLNSFVIHSDTQLAIPPTYKLPKLNIPDKIYNYVWWCLQKGNSAKPRFDEAPCLIQIIRDYKQYVRTDHVGNATLDVKMHAIVKNKLASCAEQMMQQHVSSLFNTISSNIVIPA